MRPATAGLWKTERIVIGDEDRISQHSCGHRLSVHYGASQLPGSRQQFLISLSAGRLRGCAAYFAICAASANRATTPIAKIDIALIMCALCIENRHLSSAA